MNAMGRVAVIGSGSWGTALAKLLMEHCEEIGWYFHRQEAIDEFRRCGHNPVYLSDVSFDTQRIGFTSDVNEAVASADTLVIAVPSPYLRDTADCISEIGRAHV